MARAMESKKAKNADSRTRSTPEAPGEVADHARTETVGKFVKWSTYEKVMRRDCEVISLLSDA